MPNEMVTAFIRLNGETVGAVANQPVDGESVLTRNGLEKAKDLLSSVMHFRFLFLL